MIKISNTHISGFESAIRGMRMPLMSHDKSDSEWTAWHSENAENVEMSGSYSFCIGEADKALMLKLAKGGSEHRKYLRYIHVSFDLTAPALFFAELDTYKVATVRNSSSMMHLGAKRDYTIDDFSCEDMDIQDMEEIIDKVNKYRRLYVKTKDMKFFRAMRQAMPMGFIYHSTIDMNYETLLNIYKQRKTHRLSEWSQTFCKWIETLPLMKELLEICGLV